MKHTAVFPLQRSGQLTLLSGLTLAAIPFLFHLPTWVVLLLFGQLIVQFIRLSRNQQPISKGILALFVIASIGIIFFEFRTIFGLGAGSALLLLMLGLKVLETRNYRDVMISLFLGYFTVTTAFLFNQNILLLPYLLITGFVLTLALLQLNDINGKTAIRKHLAMTGFMFSLAIPTVIVLFLVFPRLSGPLWSLPEKGMAKTGMSDSMSPGDISQLLQSNEPAFRVTFENNSPPALPMRYWRGPVLINFDGKRWSADKSVDKIPGKKAVANGELIKYRITLEPHNRNWIFPLDLPVSIPDDTDLDYNQVLRSHFPVKKPQQYTLTSSIDYRLADAANRKVMKKYLQLPENAAPKSKKMMYELSQSSTNHEEIINQVLEFLTRENFYYTLQPRTLSGNHIDDFLFNTREGFCEHYASSFVVLMRLAGIPARVVTGYMGGEWNNNGSYLLVKQSDAHAWAEVWIESRGWIKVDPTAAIAPERINSSLIDALSDSNNLPMMQRINLLNRLSLQWDLLNYYWTEWVLSYDSGRQSQFLQQLGLSLNSIGQSLYTLFIGLLVVISCWLIVFVVVLYLRKRKDPVMSSYNFFLSKIQRLGIKKAPHETAALFANRIIELHPEYAEEVNVITRGFEKLRYQPSSDRQDYLDLVRCIKSFRPKKARTRRALQSD